MAEGAIAGYLACYFSRFHGGEWYGVDVRDKEKADIQHTQISLHSYILNTKLTKSKVNFICKSCVDLKKTSMEMSPVHTA